MAQASSVEIVFRFDAIPRYEEVFDLISRGVTTANTKLNREMLGGSFVMEYPLREEEQTLLFDPQTSGGLLLSLPPAQADACVAALHEAGDTLSAVVGEVAASERPGVRIRR
jgi:selenide,water dikinase